MYFILEQSERELVSSLVESLRNWACVLFPCWVPRNRGLAVDATNDTAIEKLLAVKKNFLPDEWLVFVQDEIMHEKFICPIPDAVKTYSRKQEEKQIAVMYNNLGKISEKLANKDWDIITYIMPTIDTLWIQLSCHILRLFGKPIYASPAIPYDNQQNFPTALETIDHFILQWVDRTADMQFESGISRALTTIIKHTPDWAIKIVREIY